MLKLPRVNPILSDKMKRRQYGRNLPATDRASIACWKTEQRELNLPKALSCISVLAVNGRTVLSSISSTTGDHLSGKDGEGFLPRLLKKRPLKKRNVWDVLQI